MTRRLHRGRSGFLGGTDDATATLCLVPRAAASWDRGVAGDLPAEKSNPRARSASGRASHLAKASGPGMSSHGRMSPSSRS
jgi:hypothetical protein